MSRSLLAAAALTAAFACTSEAGGFAISVGGPRGGFTYVDGPVRTAALPVGYGHGGYGYGGYGYPDYYAPAFRPAYVSPVVYGRGPYYGGYPGPAYAAPVNYLPYAGYPIW